MVRSLFADMVPDLRDIFFVLCRFGYLFQFFNHQINGLFNAPLDGHGVPSRGHQLRPLTIDGLPQDGRRGGAVSRYVGCLWKPPP